MSCHVSQAAAMHWVKGKAVIGSERRGPELYLWPVGPSHVVFSPCPGGTERPERAGLGDSPSPTWTLVSHMATSLPQVREALVKYFLL